MAEHPHEPQHDHEHHGGHYILPNSTAHKTFVALLILTAITVGLSYVHLGPLNYIVGMLVAFTKATLVCAIFMNLRKDDKANSVIFLSSLVFLAIFIVLTATDILFRGKVYVEGPIFKPISGPSKYKTPWVAEPEMIAHGKEVFAQQCVSCHGATGHGDGPAAGALNPKPRNFTQAGDWKNGRKPSQIFKTLKEGIPGTGMASFATLPADDRWSVSHYVASLGPDVLKDDNADLAKIGIDPSKAGGGETEAPTIPIDVAMKQLVKEAGQEGKDQNVDPAGNADLERYNQRLNARSLSDK